MLNVSSRHIFNILREISFAYEPLSVTDISKRLKVPTTTTYRGVVTLEQTGYIQRFQASAQYVLGETAKQLPQACFARFKIRDITIPYLRQIAVTTGETVSLFATVGWYSVRIASIKGTSEIIHTGPLGQVGRLSDGFAGKAILAFLPEPDRKRYLTEIVAPEGAAVLKALKGELKTIRKAGYAVEPTNLKRGWAAAALPLRSGATALAAIAIEGPVLQLNGKNKSRVREWLKVVNKIEAAIQVDAELFRNPYDHIDPATIRLATAADSGAVRSQRARRKSVR